MGAKRFTELRAWQLARRPKVEVDRTILANPAAQADRRFCDQLLRRGAISTTEPGGGVRAIRPSRVRSLHQHRQGHLQETQNHLLDARDRGFVTDDEFERLWTLSDEAMASTTALLKYLNRRKRE